MLPEAHETTQHAAVEGALAGLESALVRAGQAARRDLSETEAVAMALDPSIVLPLGLRREMAEVIEPALADAHVRALRAVARDLGVIKAEAVQNVEADLVRAGQFTFDFSAPTPRSLQYASERAASLVSRIDEGQRRAIRAVVSRAISEGGNPREIAPVIRQVIGLDERQARALMNRRRKMFEQGWSPSRIERETRAYTSRALRTRAETIARTEVMDAMNAGVQDGWNTFADAGVIDSAMVVQEWIVSFDDRTCTICLPLDGEQVPLDGVFSSGDDRPPAHPRCRCTLGLVTLGTAPSSFDFGV